MRPFNLQEFAEELRVKAPDFRTADFADDILALIDIEEEVAEPYSDLCVDLDNYAPKALEGKPEKAVEWLGDRSNLLAEIEKLLEEAGHKGDADDVIKGLIGTLADAEKILEDPRLAGDRFPRRAREPSRKHANASGVRSMNYYDPEPARCVVCDARNPAGAACMGTWCPRDKGIRKEHIRKDEFDAENPMHFRLQSRGGAWRYYRRVD